MEKVGCLTLADLGGGFGLAVTLTPVIAIDTVTVATVILTIANILHLSVAVNRAP
jgi:hypothetical protein